MTDQGNFDASAGEQSPATAQVSYLSNGHCLIVAEADFALSLSQQLSQLKCTILVLDDSRDTPELLLTEDGDRIITGSLTSCTGYLGAFNVQLRQGDGAVSAARVSQQGIETFDLVFDAGGRAIIEATTPPLGYFAPRDEISLAAAVEEANEMLGDFDKPVFSLYNEKLCAHGASGKRGCEACINACSAGAIRSIGNRIELDNMLCMGCGSCTMVCPSGALRFAYPDAVTSLTQLRDVLQLSDGALRTVLFYNAESGEEFLQQQREQLADSLLPVAVEEVSSVGMDVWLSLLAFGVGKVVALVEHRDHADALLMEEQIAYAQDMIAALGHSRTSIEMLSMAENPQMAELAAPDSLVSEPATYALYNDKRQLIRRAMDRLVMNAVSPVEESVALGQGAPFGAIWVDGDKCTLCMACTSACPTGSLLAMGDTPGLRFVEESCVQCGICRNTCPESALSREARYLYDTSAAREQRTLYEEEPYRCLRCAKPFATRSGIETITAKLANHPMFKEPGSLNRLRMCDDCRVIDMMENKSPSLNS